MRFCRGTLDYRRIHVVVKEKGGELGYISVRIHLIAQQRPTGRVTTGIGHAPRLGRAVVNGMVLAAVAATLRAALAALD